MVLSDLARFVQFACALSVFGLAAWQRARLRATPAPAGGEEPRWLALYAVACLLGAAAGIGWLLAEAQTIGGTWTALGAVIVSTRFGAVGALRVALLALAALTAWAGRRAGSPWGTLGVLTGAAVLSFVWSGHGTAGAGPLRGLHTIADALHLVCAAIWIGALLMLSAVGVRAVAVRSPQSSHALWLALSRFSGIGPGLIGLLAVTGFVNSWILLGPAPWAALQRSLYGWVLIAKLALFALMLGLGWRHRYRSSPALARVLSAGAGAGAGAAQAGEPVLDCLRATLLIETLLAFLVLAAVAVLGNLEPPASPS